VKADMQLSFQVKEVKKNSQGFILPGRRWAAWMRWISQ